MRGHRLVLTFCLAVLGAAATTDVRGQPAWVPPSSPPQPLLDYLCSVLPDAAAIHIPFCAD
jgi:hypothetical protein